MTELETPAVAGGTDAPVRPADHSAESLNRALETFGLWTAFERLQKPAAIVADQQLITAMPGNVVSQGARRISVEDVRAGRLPTPLNGPYFVATATDEMAIKQRLRALLLARGIRAEIYGAFQDLVPMVLAEENDLEPGGLEAKWETLATSRSLIIACTPRSGSQFLARKLHERGVGAPREHVRPGVISLLRATDGARPGGLRFEPFWAGLVHHARQNGIFATKLISHFIRDLETNLTPAEWAMLDGFAQRSRMLYLLRSNKLLQSLSRDRAKSTQNYHLFAAEKREAYRESSQAWTYDFDRIFQEIRRINQEEVYLMGWLCRLFPAKARKPVVYETMDVDVVIRNEARAFRVPASRASVAMPTHVLRDELTVAFAERFREDYRQAFRQDDPETHAAHWLDYDTAADRLVPRTDPDSIVLPV